MSRPNIVTQLEGGFQTPPSPTSPPSRPAGIQVSPRQKHVRSLPPLSSGNASPDEFESAAQFPALKARAIYTPASNEARRVATTAPAVRRPSRELVKSPTGKMDRFRSFCVPASRRDRLGKAEEQRFTGRRSMYTARQFDTESSIPTTTVLMYCKIDKLKRIAADIGTIAAENKVEEAGTLWDRYGKHHRKIDRFLTKQKKTGWTLGLENHLLLMKARHEAQCLKKDEQARMKRVILSKSRFEASSVAAAERDLESARRYEKRARFSEGEEAAQLATARNLREKSANDAADSFQEFDASLVTCDKLAQNRKAMEALQEEMASVSEDLLETIESFARNTLKMREDAFLSWRAHCKRQRWRSNVQFLVFLQTLVGIHDDGHHPLLHEKTRTQIVCHTATHLAAKFIIGGCDDPDWILLRPRTARIFKHPRLVVEVKIWLNAARAYRGNYYRNRRSRILGSFFESRGAQLSKTARRAGFAFALNAKQYYRSVWKRWITTRKAAAIAAVDGGIMEPLIKNAMQSGRGFHTLRQQVKFKLACESHFDVQLEPESADALLYLSHMFSEANNCKYSTSPGSGSLNLNEAAYMLRRILGFERCISMSQMRERVEPLMDKYDNYLSSFVYSNTKLEFHETLIMLLKDEAFDLKLKTQYMEQLMRFATEKEPQMVRNRLRRPSMVDVSEEEEDAGAKEGNTVPDDDVDDASVRRRPPPEFKCDRHGVMRQQMWVPHVRWVPSNVYHSEAFVVPVALKL